MILPGVNYAARTARAVYRPDRTTRRNRRVKRVALKCKCAVSRVTRWRIYESRAKAPRIFCNSRITEGTCDVENKEYRRFVSLRKDVTDMSLLDCRYSCVYGRFECFYFNFILRYFLFIAKKYQKIKTNLLCFFLTVFI